MEKEKNDYPQDETAAEQGNDGEDTADDRSRNFGGDKN
jgi:hypothetical protein